jgi:hypothetical protein
VNNASTRAEQQSGKLTPANAGARAVLFDAHVSSPCHFWSAHRDGLIATERPFSVEDMALPIGASLSVRPQVGMGRAMHSSCMIGFAPNHALFVTLPLMAGEPISLASTGESAKRASG